MRRLLVGLFVLLASTVYGQPTNWGSTKAQQEFRKALTASTFFGVPRYTTVALPTCNAANTGAVAFNTTSTFLTFCNGTAWGDANSGAASAVTPASTTIAGCTSQFVIADASSLINCNAAFLAVETGTGSGVLTARKSMSGASTSSNFFRSAGTFPAGASVATYGATFSYTSTGGSTSQRRGVSIELLPGNASTAVTIGSSVENKENGTNATNYLSFGGNIGQYTAAQGATSTVTNTAHWAQAVDATNNLAYLGVTTTAKTLNIGGAFYAANSTTNTAVLAVLGSSVVTSLNTALDATNSAIAAPIATFRDNAAALPATGATATSAFLDGGWLQAGNGVLTSATMAAETQARGSGGLIHSYTWTNAQVAALAGTAGDITVATLPAKTQVRNAYVVITGQAAGPTTVTVSCGDAIGGTPFINYIVASDAKAAANTVYGDAVAERGTSLDVEFYYLPSYTATTLVTCHFISTGANLSTVTGSTGRVILETSVLP